MFGRNHVFSNILIGLGETNENVIKGMELLASKGVIPILRKVNPHPLRKDEIYVEMVTAGRLLKLAGEERRILEKYGLDVTQAVTGCSTLYRLRYIAVLGYMRYGSATKSLNSVKYLYGT